MGTATLKPAVRKFLLHWGELGSRWGVSRTVAQIHALLYLSPLPLNAEQLSDTLAVSRSNISGSLRELQNWRLIRVVHVIGDRRDHFEAVQDPWTMCGIILEERRRRELEPIASVVRECIAEAEASGINTHSRKQLTSLAELVDQVNSVYTRLSVLSKPALARILGLRPSKH
jgi:DNA-binding transcriptional regulator GbsR (MarR family)